MSKSGWGRSRLQAKFEAPDGVTALFGPSGSGKTSIVSMVAGLMTPDRGRIMCNGALLFDSDGADEPAAAPPRASAMCFRTAACSRI